MRDFRAKPVENEIEPLGVRLRRVNGMIKDLVTLAKDTVAQEREEAGQVRIAANLPPEFDERKKRRNQLLELGMQAYEELRQISSSEQTARQAEYRMQAYQVMARVGAFNAAVIRDQEAEDLAHMIAELEEGNDKLEESLTEIEEELGLRKKKDRAEVE